MPDSWKTADIDEAMSWLILPVRCVSSSRDLVFSVKKMDATPQRHVARVVECIHSAVLARPTVVARRRLWLLQALWRRRQGKEWQLLPKPRDVPLISFVPPAPVIGKSGANVRRVEEQTGARIKVQEIDKDASGERLIIVSSNEIPTEPISPTIEALILLHDKVITEMRRRTGAEIRVYWKADKPKYLSFGDELVQVAGPPAIARGALTEIGSRLRTRTLRDTSTANNPPPFAPSDDPPGILNKVYMNILLASPLLKAILKDATAV
ncbi:hypothetical protein ZEAMMB73_Zm00001d039248 [Zea mays]|uniref:K Homology domain-containing protein n=1 Tax=Zea mays TaxID=4577 RepID=A0A1D6MEQ2_MAIZE|nr:hypothetical protein ZEAMMB73_Zm00001d039248 [Zea mays]